MSAGAKFSLSDLLNEFPIFRGGAAESLIEKLVAAGPNADPWQLDLSDEEQRLLGHVLAIELKHPGVEEVQSAVACLARRRLARNVESINRLLSAAEARADTQAVDDLLLLKRVARKATASLEEF